MVIKFLCPNGHQLSAPESMAGKRGKCPKCQSAFVVPTLEEMTAAEAEEAPQSVELQPAASAWSNPPPSAPAVGASLAAEGSAVRPAMGSGTGMPAGEVFVFLCPNGHKLNGPPALKGKAGQCPHCGARFRIPTDEDIQEPQEEVPTGQGEEEIATGQLDEDAPGAEFAFGQYSEEVIDAAVEEPLAPPPAGAAGLGYIFARLWERRDHETEVEIYLTEGEIMSPDHYSEVLSSSDYGVFAVQESDGNYTVTVIPWNAVRRIGLRKVAGLTRQIW